MESTIEKMENGSIWSSIWDWLKGLFKKREEEAIDTAMFHCSDCGNDFAGQRNIADYDLNTDNLTLITKYSFRKCPKCGNWATTPNNYKYMGQFHTEKPGMILTTQQK